MPTGPGEVLELIRQGRATTRGDVLETTGLSRMTVSQRVDALLRAGLVVENGAGGATGGRRARHLGFNSAHAHVLVAAVDTMHTRVALTDLGGELLADRGLDLVVADGPTQILRAIAAAAEDLLAEAGTTLATVAGLGISVPGPVDPLTERPSEPPIMPGWDAYPVAERLNEALPGVRVLVANDADAAALGEQTHHPDARTLCLVKVSTGIGSGIVVDGSVYRGADGGAGDIGHVRLAGHGQARCQCGALGCLAAVASGRSVANSLAEHGVSAHSGRDVRTLLEQGHPDASRLTQEAGRLIGEVMATVVCVLNPAVLVVGGDLASTPLLTGIRESLYRLCLPRATRHLDLRLGRLGDDAAIVGLSRLVVDSEFSAQAVNARLGA